MTDTPSTSVPFRRLLIAVGMVGAPLCLAVGNLLLPRASGSTAAQLAAVHAHTAAYLTGSVLDAAGFGLLGALGVGIAMLLPRRGSTLGTIAALLTLLGGIVMAAAVLVTAFVEAALPAGDTGVAATLQSDPGLGRLFSGSLIAALGGLLGAIALLIGRPVAVWIPILLILGLVLSSVSGGPLSALLSVPSIAAAALLAGALLRQQQQGAKNLPQRAAMTVHP